MIDVIKEIAVSDRIETAMGGRGHIQILANKAAKELATLRGENERLRAKVTELSDEAYEYAEEVERLKEWQRQMVQKAEAEHEK